MEGDLLTPRAQLTTNPYGFKALMSDSISGGTADNNLLDSTAFLMVNGRKGAFSFGKVGFGNLDSTHINFGIECTTGAATRNIKYAAVGGGSKNKANGIASTVGGGHYNSATNTFRTVCGGYGNREDAKNAVVTGGKGNTVNAFNSVICGGTGNPVWMVLGLVVV